MLLSDLAALILFPYEGIDNISSLAAEELVLELDFRIASLEILKLFPSSISLWATLPLDQELPDSPIKAGTENTIWRRDDFAMQDVTPRVTKTLIKVINK
jgi:hypothetical protein